jgi:FKBP-type peptidyl-prolyl cis-trans isomerase FkpA
MKTACTMAALCLALLSGGAAQADEPATSAPQSAAPANPFENVKMPGGVEYRELAVGAGASAYPGSTVYVQYTGWLQNPDGSRGMKFDSSRDSGMPMTFVLGDGKVIRGWEMGLQGMKVGGRRRLFIPSALAYGTKGSTSIPPNSNLIFDVELVNVQ